MIRRLFRGRKPARALPEAELARRLTDPDYACACCGEVLHAAVGVIRPDVPFGWKNPPDPVADDSFDDGNYEVLTENFARRDGEKLLRAWLPIPVKGTDASVFIGVWCSLKIGNHTRFRTAQARGEADRLGNLSSLLYTQIPPLTGPLLTEGVLTPVPGGQLPHYWITAKKHPFHAAQQDGMTATEILSLYETFGRGDVVSHLKA